uniref:Uncharacterized protein n=1 Tax=Arundo donax TaxID=35708 RepID=A0A0A9D9E7_ARUDO
MARRPTSVAESDPTAAADVSEGASTSAGGWAAPRAAWSTAANPCGEEAAAPNARRGPRRSQAGPPDCSTSEATAAEHMDLEERVLDAADGAILDIGGALGEDLLIGRLLLGEAERAGVSDGGWCSSSAARGVGGGGEWQPRFLVRRRRRVPDGHR